MELLLNLVWVLLAVPAYWMWRRHSHRVGSLRCFLVLSCAIVLLFPIISATDDLHAMRPEMEESSPNKRAQKQAGHDKAHVQCHFGTPPAHLLADLLVSLSDEFWGYAISLSAPAPPTVALSVPHGRSPPVLSLA